MSGTLKVILSACRKLRKNSTLSPPRIFWRYCKDMQTSYFVEHFNAYLHAKNKLGHSFLSWDFLFWRIQQFDWPIAFWSITREPEFCQIWDWWWNISYNISFHFRLFPGKFSLFTNDKIFQKKQKPLFWDHIGFLFEKSRQKWIFLEKTSTAFQIFQSSTIM